MVGGRKSNFKAATEGLRVLLKRHICVSTCCEQRNFSVDGFSCVDELASKANRY